MGAAWRLVREKHASSAFDGEGAAKYGGRWNSPGVRVAYASATLSLAALETLVHLNPYIPLRYASFSIQFDDTLVERVAEKPLPRNWKASPPPPSTRRIGDKWARDARSPILAVPSTIVPREWNYLLNPIHPDFGQIRISKAEPFAFDERLLIQNR